MMNPEEPKKELVVAIGEGKPQDAADQTEGEPSNDIGENDVCLSDDSLQDYQEGDEAEASVKGVIKMNGDKRYLSITEVDGSPVGQPGQEPMNDMESATNNLKNQISKQGGYSSTME